LKIKKIVGFGDSWIYGDELLDPILAKTNPDAHFSCVQNTDYREKHCFLGLLAEHYSLPFENYGRPGGSLQSAIWTFLYWLRHEPNPGECLVLHGLTEAERFTMYDANKKLADSDPKWNKFVHSTWIRYGSDSIPDVLSDVGKNLIAYSTCEELSMYNYEQALHLFDGTSARLNIPMLQFHVSPPPSPVEVPTLIWPERNYCNWIVRHLEKEKITAPGGHPNEIGHQMIKDQLIPEIDRVILA